MEFTKKESKMMLEPMEGKGGDNSEGIIDAIVKKLKKSLSKK